MQQRRPLRRPHLQLALKRRRVSITTVLAHEPNHKIGKTKKENTTYPPSPTVNAASTSTNRPSSSTTLSTSNTLTNVATNTHTVASAK